MIVSAPDDGSARLGIQIEPGPGVGSAAFELLVRDEAGEIAARTVVERLRYSELALPCKAGRTQVFTLSADGGGQPCPNGDPRMLNFRVFWCGWAGNSHQQDPDLTPRISSSVHHPRFQMGARLGCARSRRVRSTLPCRQAGFRDIGVSAIFTGHRRLPGS